LIKKDVFFNRTVKYKEYLILDLIEYNENITQRELARLASVSVSMINTYLSNYESKGYIRKEVLSAKNIKYKITAKGVERKRYLNIGYLNSSYQIYLDAKREVRKFIKDIINKGYKDIIFYGAGEVSEILLQTIKDDNTLNINVLGVIDDNTSKQGKYILDYLISSPKLIDDVKHDAIMIASYTHHKAMYERLVKRGYNEENIMYFFKWGIRWKKYY